MSLKLSALHHLWQVVLCQILRALLWLPSTQMGYRSRTSSLPIAQPPPQQSHLPQQQTPPLRTSSSHSPPRAALDTILTKLQRRNASDIRCISWIIRNITDPKALDLAIRLAGIVQLFKGKIFVEPLYDTIVSILKACFDSTGRLYPRLRDRAYYSTRAILWIHIHSICAPGESTRNFPLPSMRNHGSYDPDLHSLLRMYDIVRSLGTLLTKVTSRNKTRLHTCDGLQMSSCTSVGSSGGMQMH